MIKGWEIKNIGEVADFQRGLTYSKNDEVEFSSNIVLRSNNIELATNQINHDELRFISDKIKISEDKKVKKGSLIICTANGSKSHLGKIALIDKDYEYAFGGFMGQLTPHKTMDSKYFFYALTSDSYKRFIGELSDGANINNLKFDDLKEFSFPVPPLPEQQRIVAILDKAFAAIDQAKANTQKNLQNAKDLFESYLHNVFANPGEDWQEKTLNDVCVVERGSSPRPIKKYFTSRPDGVNWIKIGDTELGGKYIYSTAQKITIEGAKQSRFVKEGDFILTNSMSYGRPYIMKTSGYIHDGWFVLRLGKNIDTDYFYYLLSSQYVQDQFSSLAAGAIVKNISGDLVKKALLPIPPKAIQRDLAKRFMNLANETQKLEKISIQKLNDLDELRKSILQKAFAGELTS